MSILAHLSPIFPGRKQPMPTSPSSGPAFNLSTSPQPVSIFPQDATRYDAPDRTYEPYSTSPAKSNEAHNSDSEGDGIGSLDFAEENFVFVTTPDSGPDSAFDSTGGVKVNEDISCLCEECLTAGTDLDPPKVLLPRRCLVVFDEVQENGFS